MRKEKGITIIALVVTIIILLLLAGISIGFLTGDGGLITKVADSIETSKIKEYKDVIELDKSGAEVQAGIRNLTNKEYMDSYEGELRTDAEDGNLKNSSVRRKDDDTVRVVTPEGYVFDATRDGIEYVGKQGEDESILPPEITGEKIEDGEIKEGNTKFKYDPSGWTNRNVDVSIETTVSTDGFTMQYSLDAKIWKDYTKPVTVTDYGQKIYARLINKLDESRGYATGTVLNIDRLLPNTPDYSETHTSTSITLADVKATDQAATKESGMSDIAGYYYSKDGGESWEPKLSEKPDTTKTHEFKNLTDNTPYNIIVRAIDNAGNYQDSTAKEITTVPIGTGTLTISYSKNTWTNEDVEVTIKSSKIDGYIIQYSLYDINEWLEYNEDDKPTLTKNGIVYARLKSATGTGEHAASTYGYIDKEKPEVNVELKATANTTSSITLSTTVTDTLSGLGKIVWYYKESEESIYQKVEKEYKTMNGKDAGEKTKQAKAEMISKLKAGKTYKTYAEVYDVAGNKTRTPADETKTIDVTTGAMPEVSTIKIEPSTKEWTNQNVTFTITTDADESIFKLQYSSNLSEWTDYTKDTTPTLTANGTMYARLVDIENEANVSENASSTISKIDKLEPNVPTLTYTLNSTYVSNNLTSSITISVKATDKEEDKVQGYASSGIGKYYFSTDGGTKYTTGQTEESTTIDLKPGTYKLKVKVEDRAGNPKESATQDLIVEKPKVGDTINYTPVTSTSSYSLPKNESGYTEAQTVNRENYTWKILSSNSDGTIDIMGIPTESTEAVHFMGAIGYNNGVYLLDKISETLYSNTKLGLKARSIDLNDIEQKMNNEAKEARDGFINAGVKKYMETRTYNGYDVCYPKLAAYENHVGVNSNIINSNGIDESHNGTGINGITIPLLDNGDDNSIKSKSYSKSLIVQQTGYFLYLQKNWFESSFYDIIEAKNIYWLATRYSDCADEPGYFGLRSMKNNNLTGWYLSITWGGDYEGYGSIAPVVSIGTDIKFIKQTNGSWNVSK